MSAKLKKKMDLTSFASDGGTHRAEDRGRQVTLAEAISESAKKERRGGRKAAFEGEAVVKMALFLPSGTAQKLKAMAAEAGKTPSQLVAEWVLA